MTERGTDFPTEIRYETKRRNCLMCGDGFDSAWPGERVCRRCKSNDSWRSGSAIPGP